MASAKDNGVTVTDGALDWSEGVNSDVVTTIQSQLNPNGLHRTQLSWMDNCTVRNGGIIQRFGWIKLGNLPAVGKYQGGEYYLPDNETPYLLVVIDGHVWKIPPDNISAAEDLSTTFGLVLPITERCYFCQAEMFMVIQAGDGVTLPLFWDGVTLVQSKGITSPTATTSSPPHTNEIPAATAMSYYMGRLWYAQGRAYSAGDIVGGPTAFPSPGPPFYNGRDSVLCVQENPLCVGGDGFVVPTSAGNIRGIAYAANINTQLGQGQLYVGTREQIYSLTVPVTRTDWINANSQNQPLQTVALVSNGWVNDKSIVEVNGDLFFQSLEPSIRSLTAAVRNFQQWGNVPISVNENRVLQFVDRSLLRFASGIYFDNRLLQTTLPYECPVGVAHKAIIPLNFDVISSLTQTLPPCWEGMWEGLNVLELLSADFGGRQRAFATTWSDDERNIQLWELSDAARYENNDARVVWYFETPAFTWGHEFALKKLVGAEFWYDKLYGEVILKLDYRPDGYVCWFPYHEWKCCTEGPPPKEYPSNAINRESYRQTQTIPSPPRDCAGITGRPANVGYQFQFRLTIKGFCRIRGILLHAEQVQRKLYDNMQCAT